MIQFRYEESTHYTDGRIEVYANEAPIGTLSSLPVAQDQLTWHPNDKIHTAKFQFRKEDTFLAVVRELKRYKDENGYKYLTIWAHNYGYAALIDKDILKKAGFKNLPDTNPACMFLE